MPQSAPLTPPDLTRMQGSGKTMLAQAVANLSGATWFDLSPRNTDGKYQGKQVALMIHMVFKVARLMAPSVIYIDEVEKVFLTDKKKLKEYGSQVGHLRLCFGSPLSCSAALVLPPPAVVSLAHGSPSRARRSL